MFCYVFSAGALQLAPLRTAIQKVRSNTQGQRTFVRRGKAVCLATDGQASLRNTAEVYEAIPAPRIKTAGSTALSIAVFFIYITATLFLVRRLVFFETKVHEKIVGMALATILPDMARFSFVLIGPTETGTRIGTGNEEVEDLEEESPRNEYAIITNALKVGGFMAASLISPSIGASIIMLSEVIFNCLLHLRLIPSAPYQMRTANRGAIIALDLAALVAAVLCAKLYAPLISAGAFFAIVVGYWLSKYDVDLLFPF